MQDCKRLSAVALFALASITGACASSNNARPRPFPMPSGAGENPIVQTAEPPTSTPPAPSSTPRAAGPDDRSLIATALSFRGTPYVNGGSDPSGFDCSGFIQYVFAQVGLWVPREVHEQYKFGKKVDEDEQLKPGDLVFFHTVSHGASHVGLLVGDDTFVHAPSSKGVVRVEHLSSSYWASRFLGARRVPVEPEVARRRPSAEESTVAAATNARSASRGSRAAD